MTGYRPAAEVKIALLPSEQGELKALSLTAYADTGAATNSTIAALARLIYPAEAKAARRFRRHQQSAARRCVPRARRTADGVRAGTGDRRSGAADERRSDRACANAGTPTPTASGCTIGRWTSKSGATGRTPASQSGRYRRGVGVATGYWLYLWQPGSKVEVAVKGGRLIASTATQDIGTGTRTVIANTVAREFGLEPHEVEVRIGDSNLPEGPGSGGSRITASVIPPTLLAIQKLKAAIEQNSKRKPVPGSNAPWREMLAASPDLTASGGTAGGQQADGARHSLAAEGGRLHGHDLRLDDAPLLQPCDRRRRAEFGAGDRGGSRYLARPCARRSTFTPASPSARSRRPRWRAARRRARSSRASATRSMKRAKSIPAPAISSAAGWRTTAFPESPTRRRSTCISTKAGFDHVLGGSVGIGEVATVPTSPAIANAIRNATGIRLTELPIRPDRLSPHSKGGPPHDADSHDRDRTRGIPRRRHRPFRTAAQRRLDGAADRHRRRARHHRHALGRRRRSLRIGAFTTIAAIAADRASPRAYPGIAASRARPRDAADPSSGDARRQPRAAFALLVLPQSAHRLPEEGRIGLSRAHRAIISTAWRSISAPASRRIPPPWRRRCSPMRRRSSPTSGAG